MMYNDYWVSLTGETRRNHYDYISLGLVPSPHDVQAIKTLYQCTGSLVTYPPITMAPVFSSYGFTLYNDLRYKVNVYWLNYSGEEVWYGSLYPRQSYRQISHHGHTWRVRGSGSELGVVKTFKLGEGKFTQEETTLNISYLD